MLHHFSNVLLSTLNLTCALTILSFVKNSLRRLNHQYVIMGECIWDIFQKMCKKIL